MLVFLKTSNPYLSTLPCPNLTLSILQDHFYYFSRSKGPITGLRSLMPNFTTLGVYVHGNKTTNNKVNSSIGLAINYKSEFVEHLVDY